MEKRMSTDEKPRARYLEELIQRAERDPAFRQLLLADPRAAIQEEFGIQVPEQVTLHVVEESADHVYIVLPERDRGHGPFHGGGPWTFVPWTGEGTYP
jgi:hypothetical protein